MMIDQQTASSDSSRAGILARGDAVLAGFLAAVLAVLIGSAPARAELVLMTDGAVLKVASFERLGTGERIRLELPEGGALVLPMLRIERILDDEIVRPNPEAEIATAPPAFHLRFAEEHGVPDVPYGELIFETARRHGLNPALVAAVASAESAFRDRAISHKGAQGLMQLMPATAERFGLRGDEVFDPARNLDAGSRYLSWLIDRFDGDLARVLAGYNAGEGTVDRYRGVPPYRETQTYIKRIFARLGLGAWEDDRQG